VTRLENGQPLFSVVILLFNQARLVEEALESVFGQDYSPVELLVCDDASADGSAEVAERWCREHASRFTKWKVIRQSVNRGILPNQLNGIRESRGEYIKTLAADDRLLPGALSCAARFFAGNPGFALVCGGFQAFEAVDGTIRLGERRPFPKNLDFFTMEAPSQFRYLALRRIGNMAPGIFARRSVYERIDLASTGIRLLNDLPAWLLATLAGFRIGLLGQDTCLYRRGPSSVSQNISSHGTRTGRRWRSDILKVYERVILPNLDRLGPAERFHVRYKGLQARNRLLNANRPLRWLAASGCLLLMKVMDVYSLELRARSLLGRFRSPGSGIP